VQYVDALLNRARHQAALQVGPTKGRILNNIATETGGVASSPGAKRSLNAPMPNGAAWSAGEVRFPYRFPRYSPDFAGCE
jgi:hypothetical protein